MIERSMNTELSLAMSTFTPGGRSFLTFSSNSRTPAESSSGLAVACRITPSEIESRPFRRTELRSSCGPCRTRATSPSRTVCPLTLRRATSRNCAGVRRSVAAVTLNSRSVLSMRPAGTSRLERRSASSTSCTVRL